MPDWLTLGDFAHVADFLLEPADCVPSDKGQWQACEHARARSAISRAYYAVFLALKRRLCELRPYRTFPQANVHGTVRAAVQGALGDDHELVKALRTLLRDRNRADYQLAYACSDEDAKTSVGLAVRALDLISDLSDGLFLDIWDRIPVKDERHSRPRTA